MLKPIALLIAALPLVSSRPYDEKADARAEIARMLECAREERKPLQVKNSDDFVVGTRYDRDRIRRFLGAYVKHVGDRAPGKAGRE